MERTDKIQEILKSQYEQDYLNVLGEKKKKEEQVKSLNLKVPSNR